MVTKPIHKTTTKARSLLARLVEQPNAPAIINISELLVIQGELDSALKRLVDVRDIYSGSYRYHLVSARANRDAGKYDLAKHHYEVACRLAPQNEVAIKELIELLSIPASPVAEEMGAMAYGDAYDSEVMTEEEESYNDDFSDRPSPWASGFEHEKTESSITEQGSETTGFAQANPPGLFLEDLNETETPAQDTYTSATNIFEPNIEGSNEIESTEDLFLPEGEEELDLESMQQEAFTDLFSSSSFNAEALQREAIRQIEAERGPISEDPFVDFEADLPGESPFSKGNKPAPQGKSISDLPRTGMFDETTEPVSKQSDSSNRTDQSGSDLFVGYDDEPESAAPESPFAYTDDDDDLADFKIDRAKLASALTKLQSEPEKHDPDSNENEIMNETDFGAIEFNPTAGSDNFLQDQSETNDIFDLDRLAADLSKMKFKPIEETNDPTPISEQRKPYSDEEEIKMPTRSLAQIFVNQGAYAKAIKVYESLIEHDPENAPDYETQIELIHQKMIGG
ncbi:MAG: hypothetical protein HGB11_04790 [Chlorobiales bacterium]|nr:hypothetical protein [Chlorobiales bacterium]